MEMMELKEAGSYAGYGLESGELPPGVLTDGVSANGGELSRSSIGLSESSASPRMTKENRAQRKARREREWREQRKERRTWCALTLTGAQTDWG